MAMVKTTVYLPESMKRSLERAATDRGVSEAVVIRESLERSLVGVRPKPRFGFITEPDVDGATDVATNMDKYLVGFGED
jgi:hypothetical protein